MLSSLPHDGLHRIPARAAGARGHVLETQRLHQHDRPDPRSRDRDGPTGPDAEILYRRRDTHFSQKVRNLKSNRRLKRYGWALYVQGGFSITDKGRAYVNRHIFGRVASSLTRYADASGRIPPVEWTEENKELVDRAEANLAVRERQAAELGPKQSALLARHRNLLEELLSQMLLDSNPDAGE